MTALEWLTRSRDIEQEIEQLRKIRAEFTASTRGSEKKISALDRKITRQVDSLVKIRTETLDLIGRVGDSRCRTLLLMRYVRLKSWEEIAAEMGYSLRQIYRIHGDALHAVDQLLSPRSKRCH